MIYMIYDENIWIFKAPLCTTKDIECVRSTKLDDSECLQQCSGLFVTSYDQLEIEERSDVRFRKLIEYLSGKSYISLSFDDMAEFFQG